MTFVRNGYEADLAVAAFMREHTEWNGIAT